MTNVDNGGLHHSHNLVCGVWGGPTPCYDTIPESDDWRRRFDVTDVQLLEYKAKLLDMPQLTPASTLPDRV